MPSVLCVSSANRIIMPVIAYIGIGSNMGDKKANCLQGHRTSGERRPGRPRFLPVLHRAGGVHGAGGFHQCGCWRSRPTCRPRHCCNQCQVDRRQTWGACARSAGGRVRSTSTSCCTATLVIETPELTIPHPLLHSRTLRARAACRDRSAGLASGAETRPHRNCFCELQDASSA